MRSSHLLEGFAIGVTADRRADEQISLFQGRGAECMHGATVRTHPIRPEAEIREATIAFIDSPPDMLVATTGIGVRGWLEAADAIQLGEQLRAALTQTRVFVRGPKTHGAAITAGLDVEWNAATATTAEIVRHLATVIEPGHRVAIQIDGSPEQPIIGQIAALGAEVTAVPVYRWTLPDDPAPAEALVRAVAERRLDAVTFTSRPAAENFTQIAHGSGLFDDVERAFSHGLIACCVGSISAEGLHTMAGIDVVQPERFRLGAMVMTLTHTLNSRGFTVPIGGVQVLVQGRRITVGDETAVNLSLRERQLLGALLTRPGAVRSKKQLLTEVWQSTESNPHVVEVTVGRLRRRLGKAGVGIETVMKRGYRVSPD